MLGIERRAARAAWTVFLVLLLIFVLYLVRKVLFVFIAAILLAYLLAPVVNLVNRFSARRISRAYSLGVVYILLIGLLVLLGITIGARISEEAASLAERFPGFVKDFETRLQSPEPAWLAPGKRALLSVIREKGENLGSVMLPVVQAITGRLMSVVGGLIVVFMVPVLSFFFLKDAAELREKILGGVGEDRRGLWEDIFSDLHRLLGQFIRALVMLSVATFIAYAGVFAILNMPYAILLASFAAVLEFIPVLGPLVAAITIALVALVTGHGPLWAILLFLAGYRLFQDYVLSPHLMSAGMELHPLLVIFGALAGEAIAGIPGMFLSVPVMAALRIFYVRIQKDRRRPQPLAAS